MFKESSLEKTTDRSSQSTYIQQLPPRVVFSSSSYQEMVKKRKDSHKSQVSSTRTAYSKTRCARGHTPFTLAFAMDVGGSLQVRQSESRIILRHTMIKALRCQSVDCPRSAGQSIVPFDSTTKVQHSSLDHKRDWLKNRTRCEPWSVPSY